MKEERPSRSWRTGIPPAIYGTWSPQCAWTSEAVRPEWRPHPPPAYIPPFPDKVKQTCLGCHGQDMIAGQHLTRTQWEREVDKMTRWGAAVTPDDRPEI